MPLFRRKSELVYKNPLKRSILKSQFQKSQNMDVKIWFFHDSRKNNFKFTTEQKIRLNTLSHRLLGWRSPTKYYVKIKINQTELKPVWDFTSIWDVTSLIIFQRSGEMTSGQVSAFTWLKVKWNSLRYKFGVKPQWFFNVNSKCPQ